MSENVYRYMREDETRWDEVGMSYLGIDRAGRQAGNGSGVLS